MTQYSNGNFTLFNTSQFCGCSIEIKVWSIYWNSQCLYCAYFLQVSIKQAILCLCTIPPYSTFFWGKHWLYSQNHFKVLAYIVQHAYTNRIKLALHFMGYSAIIRSVITLIPTHNDMALLVRGYVVRWLMYYCTFRVYCETHVYT